MSNQDIANRRIVGVILLVVACAIMALLGWYPSNYESLFTPLNKCIDYFAYFSLLFAICLCIPNIKLPGEKTISDISFVHMILTMGIACAFFSYCADPSFIVNSGTDRDPYAVIGFWYGPWEWLMFLPFIFVEAYESIYGLPKWLSTIKIYVYSVSMMLGIGISMMAGCTTIPKIVKALWGYEISPFLLIIPFAALISVSLIRGLHKGMKLFSNITMILVYIIMFFMICSAISSTFMNEYFRVFGDIYGNIFSWMHFTGTEFEIKHQYTYWFWGLTWVSVFSSFIKKISEGRSWRSVILLFVFGVSFICESYAAISEIAFTPYGGDGIKFLADHSYIAIIYIMMLIMMFVTSADSTCFIIDDAISKGVKAPIVYRKLLWIVVMSAFVSVLLISSGGTTDAIYGISYITVPIIVATGLTGLGIVLYKIKTSRK